MKIFEARLIDVNEFADEGIFVGYFSSEELARQEAQKALEAEVAEDGTCLVDDFEIFVEAYELDKNYFGF
jgi:hypothetical protein